MSSSGKASGGGGVSIQPAMRTGLYYPVRPFSSGGSGGQNNARLFAQPLYIPAAITLATIGVEIITAGSTGSVLRLGLYKDDGTGYPGALIIDAGTVDGTQVAGFYEIVINQAVIAGILWAAFVQQGSPGTTTAVRMSSSYAELPGSTTGIVATQAQTSSGQAWATAGGPTGALPATFPAGATGTGGGIRMAVKVA